MEHPARPVEQCRHVGGHDVLAIPDPDDKGRSLTEGDDGVGLETADRDHRELALQAGKHAKHPLEERTGLATEELRDELGVGVGAQLDSIVEQIRRRFLAPGRAPTAGELELLAQAIAGCETASTALEGIAITATAGNGTWQYSTDGGGSWIPFGAVSDSSAVVLGDSGNDRIRFLPATNFNGTAEIAYRAWDRTDGNPSGATGVDASIVGGATPFR